MIDNVLDSIGTCKEKNLIVNSVGHTKQGQTHKLSIQQVTNQECHIKELRYKNMQSTHDQQ